MSWLTKFWKSSKKESPANTILFSLDEGDLKLEFSYDDIDKFIAISDLILNNKIRSACIENILSKINDGGLHHHATLFSNRINKTIKPSEYGI